MQKIEVNRRGIIKSKDDYNNWFLLIQDDAENTGGYLILIEENIPNGRGYDGWVEKFEDLTPYIEESKWEIEWLPVKNSF